MKSKRYKQEQKLAIIKSAEKMGIKEAADVAGVHYTTVYEWKNLLEALGEEEFLSYKASTPGRGIKQISPKKEEAVLETWKRYPGMGPGQVRNQLRRQGLTVSIKTVRKLMEANGYKNPRKRDHKKEDGARFEARRPLELVQMDILEFFINKLKVYVLLLLDDFSRFILGFRLVSQTSIDEVIGLVQEAIDQYGKMEEILTDRGFVFYSWQGANRFEKYLEVERIDHTHASAHHPQTLGKIEALNGHVRTELLDQQHFMSVMEAERALSHWIFQYNYERTHQGLGGLLVPADRFHGLTDLVLSKLEKNLDPQSPCWYSSQSRERSVLSVTVGPAGAITLYLLGHPISVGGNAYGRSSECGRSGHSD